MSVFEMEPLVRNAWYIGAWANELADGPIGREIMNEDVVLFRDGEGKAAALEDRCCHRGVKLSLGSCNKGGLVCGYHGLVFDGKGACIDNPGEKLNPSYSVRAYPVVERQNFIWIWTGDPARADPSLIIDWPFHDDWSCNFGRYDIDANFMFMVDNLMDLTHLGYVHGSTIGGNPEQHNDAELTTTKRENGAHFLRWMLDSVPPPSFKNVGGFTTNIDRWSDFEYIAPSSVLQWGGGLPVGRDARKNRLQSGALSLRQFHHATPKSENQYHYFFSAGLDGLDADSPGGQQFYEDILEAFLEDKLFIESQQSGVERDPSRRLLLREHDRAVAYSRQAIHEMQADEVQREAAE